MIVTFEEKIVNATFVLSNEKEKHMFQLHLLIVLTLLGAFTLVVAENVNNAGFELWPLVIKKI